MNQSGKITNRSKSDIFSNIAIFNCEKLQKIFCLKASYNIKSLCIVLCIQKLPIQKSMYFYYGQQRKMLRSYCLFSLCKADKGFDMPNKTFCLI